MTAKSPWKNRIVGHGEEAPDQLLANPSNWRIHPKNQQDALSGVLDEVGWIQSVIVSQRSGHVVDGHLRVALAISRNEPSIPVVYVDLDEAEEKLALASIDPLAAMAATDREQLAALLEDVSTGDAALQAMLDQLAQDAGLVPPVDPMAEWQGMPEFDQPDAMPYRTIIVHFEDDDAVEDFARRLGQSFTDKTKDIWHPAKPMESRMHEQYVSDES